MQTELIISFFFNPLPATYQALFSSIIPSELPTNWCPDLTWLGWTVRNHLYFSVFLVHKSHSSGGRCLLPFAYSVGQFSLLLENKASALACSRLCHHPSWHQWPLGCSTTWGFKSSDSSWLSWLCRLISHETRLHATDSRLPHLWNRCEHTYCVIHRAVIRIKWNKSWKGLGTSTQG